MSPRTGVAVRFGRSGWYNRRDMGSSLRDIPGAGGGRRKGRLGSVSRSSPPPWQPPPKGGGPRKAKKRGPALRFQGPRRQVDRFNLALGAAFVVLFVAGGVWLWRANAVSVSSDVADGSVVPAADVADFAIRLQIEPRSRLDAATVLLDGEDVAEDVEVTEDALAWTPPEEGLDEGTYELALEVPKPLFGTESWTMTFRVDDPPQADGPAAEG